MLESLEETAENVHGREFGVEILMLTVHYGIVIII